MPMRVPPNEMTKNEPTPATTSTAMMFGAPIAEKVRKML
jgi:hypothetical protein